VLEVDVHKRLGGFDLRATFTAERGTTVLFGHSGSGKSLTLAAVAGLVRPDAGRISLDGDVLLDRARGVDLPPERRRVGYVPQGYALFPHLTVAQNIAYGLPRAGAAGQVEAALRRLRLEGIEGRRPSQISGGQAQRVALARALVVSPRLLLLDEPFAALDAEIRRALRAELGELRRQLDIAVLFVTHDLAEAHAVGDRVVVFDAGAVLQVGPTEQVFDYPATRRVAELTATRNVLPGVVVGPSPDGLLARVGPHQLETPARDLRPGTAVDVCIRPEHVLLVRHDRGPHVGPRRNVLDARIVREVAQGAFHTLYLRLDPPLLPGDHDLELDLSDHPYEVMGVAGRRDWSISLKPSALHLIPRD
jgi:molybdate transport system ATP-binding protein